MFALVDAIPCKVSQTRLCLTLRELEKRFESFFVTMMNGQHTRQFSSVDWDLDSEILAALQTVETVVRTQRYCLDAHKFPMFSGGWTWQGVFRDLDSCWFGLRTATMMCFGPRAGSAFEKSKTYSLCHRSFFSWKGNALNV